MVKSWCSNLSLITANFSVSEFLGFLRYFSLLFVFVHTYWPSNHFPPQTYLNLHNVVFFFKDVDIFVEGPYIKFVKKPEPNQDKTTLSTTRKRYDAVKM